MTKIDELPSKAGNIAKDNPDVWKAYSALGEACAKASVAPPPAPISKKN